MKKELIILSGFLGSGKTTLLQGLLRHYAGRKLAVVLNDFGKEAVDGVLLARAGVKEKPIEISGGSVFCSCLSATLVKTLHELALSDRELVILEASGMSDPSTIDKMLRLANLDEFYDHSSTICLFDPVKSLKLAHVLEVIPRQLDSATVAVLTKTDLYSKEQIDAARAYIRQQAPQLPVLESSMGVLSGDIPSDHTGKSFAFSLNTPMNRPDCLQISEISCTVAELLPLLEQPAVLRVKGFVRSADGTWFISDTGQGLQVEACTDSPTPLVVITMQGHGDKLQQSLAQHHIL